MTTTFSKRLRFAFVLEKNDIIDIVDLYKKYFGETKISIQCSDSTSIIFDSVDELFEFPNKKNRRIVSLDFLDSKGLIGFPYLAFGKSILSENIEIQIRGDDKNVIDFSRELIDIIENTRPWYSTLAKFDYTVVTFLLTLTPMFGFLSYIGIKALFFDANELKSNIDDDSSKMSGLEVFVIFAFGGILLLLGMFLNRIRDAIFPMSLFSIGDGERLREQTEKVRYFTITAVIVPVPLGIILNLLF